MRRNPEDNKRTDLEECHAKIVQILREYNCSLNSTYDYSHIFIKDNDTEETIDM